MEGPLGQSLDLIGGVFGCVFGVIALAFMVWIYWKIFAKSGNSGALSLLMLIPIVNVILVIWFAFSEWPIERELNSLRMGRQAPPPQQLPPQVPPQPS